MPLLLDFLVALTLNVSAWQELPATGNTASVPGALSHGWVALPEPTALNLQATMLAHVAPRKGAAMGAAAAIGADDGALLPVMRLESMPVGLAGCDDSLYLFFGPQRVGGGVGYEVLSLQAFSTPIADLFAYEPRGRLNAHPSLVMSGAMVGCVGSPFGPVALMHEPGPVNMPELSLLEGKRWVRLEMPPTMGGDGVDATRRLELVAIAGGVGIVGTSRSGELGFWRGEPVETKRAGGEWVWSFEVLPPLPGGGRGEDGDGEVRVIGVGEELFAVSVDDSILRVWTRLDETWAMLGERPGIGEKVGLSWLAGQGRLVAVWQEESASQGAGEKDPLRARRAFVWEISGGTGIVLHDGAATRSGPLSTGDFRALVVLLFGVTAAVLLFVVRVGDEGVMPRLPEGAMIAMPGRRAFGAFVDAVIAASVVSFVSGASLSSLVDVLRLTPGGYGVMGLVQITFVGFLMSTIGEAISGRTLGKALAGCVVLPVVEADAIDRAGIGLGRALRRNAVKWGLPPAALLGVFEIGGRHRGDVVGRTIVAQRAGAAETGDGERNG